MIPALELDCTFNFERDVREVVFERLDRIEFELERVSAAAESQQDVFIGWLVIRPLRIPNRTNSSRKRGNDACGLSG